MSPPTSDIAAGDDRTTAQFFFEVGYSAAWADAYMANGKKAAFPISDESLERAWAIAPEAHDDREEWDRHMAATQQPPLRIIKDAEAGTADLAPISGAVSDHAIRSLQIRSPLNQAIYGAIRDFRMGNMCDEDGYPWPLVDLMSNPAPCDISTGEAEMVSLADDVCEAVEALSGWQPIETAPKDGTPILAYGPLPGCNADEHSWHGVRETKWKCYPLGSPGYVAWERGEGPLGIGWDWYESVHNWSHVWKPTHWMPLPSAPSQIEEG